MIFHHDGYFSMLEVPVRNSKMYMLVKMVQILESQGITESIQSRRALGPRCRRMHTYVWFFLCAQEAPLA